MPSLVASIHGIGEAARQRSRAGVNEGETRASGSVGRYCCDESTNDAIRRDTKARCLRERIFKIPLCNTVGFGLAKCLDDNMARSSYIVFCCFLQEH